MPNLDISVFTYTGYFSTLEVDMYLGRIQAGALNH